MASLYFPCKNKSSDPFYATLHQTIKTLLNMTDGKDIKVGKKRTPTHVLSYKTKDIKGEDGKVYMLQSYNVDGIHYTGLHLSGKGSRIKSYGSRGIDARHIITVDGNGGFAKANYTDAKIEAILGEVVQEVRDCEGNELLATLMVG